MTEGNPTQRGSGSDILVRWAAEEFVAAGRVVPPATQSEHRRRALFFTEVFRELRTVPSDQLAQHEPQSEIGKLLAQAFGGQVSRPGALRAVDLRNDGSYAPAAPSGRASA